MKSPNDRQFLLHMGHPKTGTSALQRALRASEKQLAQQGTLYPDANWVRHNHRVHFIDVLQRKQSNLVLKLGGSNRAREAAEAGWQRLSQELESGVFDRVIMSSEGLLGNAQRADRQVLTDRLSRVTNQPIRALAYIREPSRYYLSQLQQRLKGGRGMEMPRAHKWSRSIKFCRQELGFDLEVRAYDRNKLIKADIVADFWDWAQLDPALQPQKQLEVNVSLSSEAMAVLLALGLKSPAKTKSQLYRQRQLVRAVRKTDQELAQPSRPTLRPEWRDYVSRINQDYLVLRDDFGLTYPDLDYDLIGQDLPDKPPRLEKVQDLCDCKEDRLAELKARVQQDLARASGTKKSWTSQLRARLLRA